MPTDDYELRERLVRAIWAEIRNMTVENVRTSAPASRAIASGADPQDVVLAMTGAKYEMAFALLYLLTGMGVEPGNDEASTGWALAKVEFDGDDEFFVGTDELRLLFEDLLTADPTGLEGSDFLSR